ncbi:hypothetical protein BV25DRAFT_1890520 [Artomyces pyxidatus]|uniref:Uncharacterized protein n=1 Tax=Artomyces pyxidatus TaxID=48021 RepID=A0ACB8SR50_9AGAM|nr:hypothetical protein BV25DRAFT_1890520 [Artomyces pyxidatus]
MAAPPAKRHNPISPISQLLQSLGMTRDDLTRHSDQMRQFLTAENASSSRTSGHELSDDESVHTPTPTPSQLPSKSRSVSTADASLSTRTTPPPVTPIKTEPVESSSSLRRFDSMDMIIERQNRRSKRDRRSKRERDDSPALPRSPSLSRSRRAASVQSRDSGRVLLSAEQLSTRDSLLQDDTLPPPVTPRPGRYYRDTVLYQTVTSKPAQRQDVYIPRPESPSPSRSRRSSIVSSLRSVSVESVAAAKAVSPFPPVTPRRSYYKSQFPPSSSPATSTPSSSPSRPIVNIVSSPGPMGPEPAEEEYDELPFQLPPGPYSPHKPDLPYAALIGQAILASPEHRLTLQEIYDYITIVYPHFKRNEQTWMNSIRHVLSTTIVFRKVQRDRAAGRTLWAIFERDLECFASGGFRKEFCADMQEQKARYTSRKRTAEDSLKRKAKRSKKGMQEEMIEEQIAPQMGIPLTAVPPMSFSAPLFPPLRPGTHHQPYYAPYMFGPPPGHPHTLPVGVIFPTLPPGAAYPRMIPGEPPVAPPPASQPSISSFSTDSFMADTESPSPTLLPASSSSSSLPPLTPNNSSSSPHEPMEEVVSEMVSPKKTRPPIDISAYIVDPEDPPLDALAPGITLLNGDVEELEKTMKTKGKARKGKEKEVVKEKAPAKNPVFPPTQPESPTLSRQALSSRPKAAQRLFTPPREVPPVLKPLVTPPQCPSTPPRKLSAGLQLSATRTPLSHLGVHMSPSPSLAHYKSNLNPPPTASVPLNDAELSKASDDAENLLHTPSKRRTSSHFTPFTPATPRKLTFPGAQDSPFRTPGRGIFDPHDPSALLDEELTRFGAQGSGLQESPAGLFGRGAGMLYQSPDAPSPGRWNRMW